MDRQIKLYAAVALAFTAAIATWQFTKEDQTATRSAHPSPLAEVAVAQNSGSAVAKAEAAASASVDQTWGKDSQGPPTGIDSLTTLRAKFATSTNYGAFIREVLASGVSGGRFYAWQAYSKCRRLSRVQIEVSQGDSAEVAAAKAALLTEQAPCLGVMDMYGEDSSFYRVLLDSKRDGDFFFPPQGRGLLVPGSDDEANQALSIARRSQDPYMLAAALEINAEPLMAKLLGDEAKKVSTDSYYAAISVVACELRKNCDSAALNAGRCAFQGQCAVGDYPAWVRSKLDLTEVSAFDSVVNRIRRNALGS